MKSCIKNHRQSHQKSHLKSHPAAACCRHCQHFIIAREDGLYLARYQNQKWHYVSHKENATALPRCEAMHILETGFPKAEGGLWTMISAEDPGIPANYNPITDCTGFGR